MKKFKILDNTTIKLIAIIIMLMDHITIAFFPEKIIFIKIGEIAFPLFAFCIAEGFHYTKDKKKYFLNLFGFAIISEVCFDLGLYGKIYWFHQNVLFTMSIAVLSTRNTWGRVAGSPQTLESEGKPHSLPR